MHPSPRGPITDQHTQQQKGRAPEDAGAELVVKPPSDEQADQRWHYNDPAQNTNLADKSHHRGFAFGQPPSLAPLLFANSIGHAIRWSRLGFHTPGIHDPPPRTPGLSGRR